MTRWQISLLGTGSLLVLLTLTGCGSRDVPETPPKTAPVDLRTIEKGDRYVAIGDSYTSAPGTGRSADGCMQTTTNYPHKIAAKLELKLTDVSCGGAATQHVMAPHVFRSIDRPPQADALSPITDLVTISIGGNDANTLGFVAFNCTVLRSENPTGAPCRDADRAGGGSIIERKIEAAEQRLVGVIKNVAKRAPTARILVVGYPEFFPESGPCTQLPLAFGDYAFAHRINELIVDAQKDAAARTGVEYVDVFTASRGHDMCAQDPWIAGLEPTRSDATRLHPYPEEQQLVADLVVDMVTGAATPNRGQPTDR